jgi:hypothetical protein
VLVLALVLCFLGLRRDARREVIKGRFLSFKVLDWLSPLAKSLAKTGDVLV